MKRSARKAFHRFVSKKATIPVSQAFGVIHTIELNPRLGWVIVQMS
jgi:hypothetical protein